MFGIFNKRDAPEVKKKRNIIMSPGAKQDIYFEGYTRASDNEDVRKCVHIIADLVSDMTIMLLENGEKGDTRIKNSLSYKIDVEPNRYMTRKQFIYRIATDMMMRGNSVVYPKIKDGLIDDLDLFYMPSVSYQDTANGYAVRYKGKVYDMDNILNFVFIPSELKPYIGEGFFWLVKNAVDNLGQAEKTKNAFLKSKWKPSLIFSVTSDADEVTDADKRENILNSYVSETEQGRPWIIPADELKIETIKPLSLNDLGIHESIKLEKQVISAALGVPAFLLGVGTYSNDEYNNFISTTIYSFAQIIQQEMTRKLLLDPKWYFKFNPRSLMMYNLSEKTAHVKDMVGLGMMNRNEGRNQFDYSPVDADGMDDYSVLENYIPVDKIGEQKKLNELLQKSLRYAIMEFEKREDPDPNRVPKGNPNGGQFTFKASAQGSNDLEKKGFVNKQKLNNHWQNGRTHKDEYIKDGITTAEQYEKRAVELAESETGDNILGHLDKYGHIVRYDIAKNDFVKADIKKGVITMYKPDDKKDYYDTKRKEDIEHGGQA